LYLANSRAGWEEGRSNPELLIPAGDRVVVFVHARVLPKGTAKWQDINLADVYTFRDGKCREPQHELMKDKEFHELFRQATILLPCAPQFCALRPRVP